MHTYSNMTRSIRHAAATGRSLKHNGTPSISLKMFMHSVEISPRFSTIFCRSGKHTFGLGLGPQRVFGFRWNECEVWRRDPSSEPCLLVFDAISCNRGGQQNCFIRKGPYPELGLHAVATGKRICSFGTPYDHVEILCSSSRRLSAPQQAPFWYSGGRV